MALFLGAVADDDTGATDLGNMLMSQGMQVAVVALGDLDALRETAVDCDAVIVGTASRSVAKLEAYRRTQDAVRWLIGAGAHRVLIKYCSTFDSTAEGNIGASIDAAMDEMQLPFTLALPAQPSLGRTTYMGYQFVHQQLLSDSPMRNHPLTPMTNPNLLSHLGTQTSRSVGLLPYAAVASGASSVKTASTSLRDSGVQITVCDCVDETQLQTLGEAACELKLLTGSSAWGMVLPSLWQTSGEWVPSALQLLKRKPGGRGVLCVSGSCSAATARQIAWASENGFHVITRSPDQLTAEMPHGIRREIADRLASEDAVLLTTQADPDSVSTLDKEERAQFGEQVAVNLAKQVKEIVDLQLPAGLVIAGGETSSTVMRTLNLGGLRIGDTVEHGVPLCTSLRVPSLAIVLKSGNFGSDDFFGRAVNAVLRMPVEEENA